MWYLMSMRFRHPILVATLTVAQALTAQSVSGRSMTPWAVAADLSRHVFYAVDSSHDAVIEIDPVTHVSRTIAVGRNPIALALDADAERLYVVDAGSGDLAVVDTALKKVVARPKTDKHPYAIAVDTTLHRVFVSNTFSNKLTVFDATTGTTQDLPLGSKDALLCDPARHRVYMTSYEDKSVAVLDDVTGAVTRLPAEMHLWGMALQGKTGDLLVTSIGAGTLLRLSAGADTTATRTGSFPSSVAVDGDTAAVTNSGDGSVSIVRGQSVQRVRVGSRPQAVAVEGGRHQAFVVDTHEGTVTTLDLQSGSVVATLAAGNVPYAIAVDPKTKFLIVANLSANTAPAYTVIPMTPAAH